MEGNLWKGCTRVEKQKTNPRQFYLSFFNRHSFSHARTCAIDQPTEIQKKAGRIKEHVLQDPSYIEAMRLS